MNLPIVVDAPVPWKRKGDRREEIQGALVHAMGEYIVVEDGTRSALDFLRESPDLTGESYSAHCLVKPDGTLQQCVDDHKEAFHAGFSRRGNLTLLNRSFLGLEFLLPGTWSYGPFIKEMKTGSVHFTEAQYRTAGWRYASWMLAYGFGRGDVVSHSSVAGDNVRGEGKGKRDPGVGFNHGMLTNWITRWTKHLQEAA